MNCVSSTQNHLTIKNCAIIKKPITPTKANAVLHNYGNQTNPTFTIRLMALQGPDQLDVLTKKGQFLGVMQQGKGQLG